MLARVLCIKIYWFLFIQLRIKFQLLISLKGLKCVTSFACSVEGSDAEQDDGGEGHGSEVRMHRPAL